MKGPFNNPFMAAVAAMDEKGVDTVEFMQFSAWDAVAYYPFHLEDEFIPDTMAWLSDCHSVKVEHRDDGYYAEYFGD